MKLLAAAFVILLILAPATASAQTLTPQDARATLTMARAEVARAATQVAAASELATANAPTQTPVPTWTPAPTATGTSTPAPTVTPQPTHTATAQPSATSAATATMVASATATREPATAPQGEDITSQRWQVFGILLFCIVLLGGLLWFMRDRTFYLPRGGRNDDRK